jgi:hypothetical protein
MYCKLGKQVLMDVVLDYLESKYSLPSVFGLSIVERIWRIQEQIKYLHDISILETDYNSKARKTIQWDDWSDGGWGKYC